MNVSVRSSPQPEGRSGVEKGPTGEGFPWVGPARAEVVRGGLGSPPKGRGSPRPGEQAAREGDGTGVTPGNKRTSGP